MIAEVSIYIDNTLHISIEQSYPVYDLQDGNQL